MKRSFILILAVLLFLFVLNACNVNWTTAISYGDIISVDFNESIDIEIENGLIFLPVQIEGKTYRFLFDTGAPFSISEELQRSYNFDVISKGHIVDSDNNRKQVNYIQVDTITLGSIPFMNQTAFEGDFNSNPILECLEIDGIVGSNLIRHANWTIDQNQKKITISNSISEKIRKESIAIPFRTDQQYNMILNLSVDTSLIQNLTVDYGSNGPIALPENIFSVLKQRSFMNKIFVEVGSKRSGIIGKSVILKEEITITDSIKINKFNIQTVEVRTGSSGLIGNKILSRFLITIDWNQKIIYISKRFYQESNYKYLGFTLGFTLDKGIYVQSVIEGSMAYDKGIEPNMKVLKIDSLDFLMNDDYCDYVSLVNNGIDKIIYMELLDSIGLKKEVWIDRIDLLAN